MNVRRAAIGALCAAVLVVAAFAWLFGSGAVFGQEADTWETTKVIVRARVLGDDLVRLSEPPERWVATDDGRRDYLTMLQAQGFTFVEYFGGGMLFRRSDGARCAGSVEQFTAVLVVYTAPGC